ncbi:hypothetical protein [Mobiluncus mulieris]|uniref:hypothetical protein n=1 Tax=Mobiluncus mulieris TaxID=2052 RepID=UPI0014705481|nr:hypothetical protein [Mobiluncus mulieris]NMX11766.1 hypothetical protein [Mobiluncus mulieris]
MSIFETQGFLSGVDPELLAAQIRTELLETLGEPLGAARLAHLQDLANSARKHFLGDLEISIRLEIGWDGLDSGNTELALSNLAWVLDYIAHHPDELDEEQRLNIATQMLQVPPLAVRHPRVDVPCIENLVFWMEFFASKTGIDLHSRLSSRHQVELGLGKRLAAGEALDVMSRLEEIPRQVTGEVDCPLHHFRSRIAWAVNAVDYPRALSLYREALGRCSTASWQCFHPEDIDPLLMLPQAWAGQGDVAWRAHERSYRHQSESSQYLGDIASQLRFCAATWSLDEGLEILHTHAHWFANPEDPWDLLVAARAAAALLRRALQAYRNLDTTVPELDFAIPGNNPWFAFESLQPGASLATAQARLERVARGLALAFDARNGNNTISMRTAALLNQTPLCSWQSVRSLLRAHFAVAALLGEHGFHHGWAAWLLPALDEGAAAEGHVTHGSLRSDGGVALSRPVPGFSLLDFMRSHSALTRFHQAVSEVNFVSLPREISADHHWLLFEISHVALLGLGGHWDEMLDCGLPLVDLAESLDSRRQSLRVACYLIQAYWQLGRLGEARQWLIRADDFVDATTPAELRMLLEELALLAG